MNAAVQILEDLNFADPATEPEQEQQRQLANELARTPTKRAALEHELREVEGELQDLAPQRERHHLVVEACAALEKLAAVGGDKLFLGADPCAQRAARHL